MSGARFVVIETLGKRKFDSLRAKSSATPPPPTTPSSTAALVACIASSTRSLRSLTSTSLFAADADDGDLARQLGETLLELLAVVIGGRLLQALVKRDGFTRRYIQRLGLPRLSKPGPGRGNPASRQPVELTASRLTELDLPLEWIEQRKLLAS